MWRLLGADFRGRMWVLSGWTLGIAMGTLGLTAITQPTVPVLYWGVILLSLQPILVNGTCGGQEAGEKRIHRQVVLPVPISSVGLARLLLPGAIQLAGGGLALALAVGGSLTGRPAGHWSIPLWLTFGLLCLGQWYGLQRELYLQAPASRGGALITGLAALTVLLALSTFLLVGIYRVLAPFDAVGLRTALFNLLGPLALSAPTAALIAANLSLFVRRDAVAE